MRFLVALTFTVALVRASIASDLVCIVELEEEPTAGEVVTENSDPIATIADDLEESLLKAAVQPVGGGEASATDGQLARAVASHVIEAATGIARLEALDRACPRYRIDWTTAFGSEMQDRQVGDFLREVLRSNAFSRVYNAERCRIMTEPDRSLWAACADLIERAGLDDLLPE